MLGMKVKGVQSESVHKTYLTEQDVQNVLIESVDMSYDSEQIEQNDEDADLAKERERYFEIQDLKAQLHDKGIAIKIVLFIVDSGCSKHMAGNLKLLINFMEKFLGTVKFGNDQITPILGYGDLVQGAITIKRVYYVEGLNHNLFSVGQFCDADLEVAFRKSTCFIRDLKGNDLLSGNGYDKKGQNPRKTRQNKAQNGKRGKSKAYRVFNKRTRVIMESIHVNFDELPQMASDQLSSDPAPECQTMALNHDSLSPANQHQANVTQSDTTVTTSNELDLLFSLMYDELLNGSLKVVSKSSTVSAANDPNQQTYAEIDQVADDEFINIFSNQIQDQGETSTCHVDSSNMHTFYQRHPSEHRWTKDHPLEQVIGNPSQSVRTRQQLESDAKMHLVGKREELVAVVEKCESDVYLRWDSEIHVEKSGSCRIITQMVDWFGYVF
nr:integrase, catalytic region, zinc finger, CCHC-type, peptidase aspartic, catalytic [Tanacetum cinerariifolium]